MTDNTKIIVAPKLPLDTSLTEPLNPGRPQTGVKLKLQRKALKQTERWIDLDVQKFRRASAAIALKVLADDLAKAIAARPPSNAEMIEIMGRRLFGDLWKPRPPED
jgi:hypothetical protein